MVNEMKRHPNPKSTVPYALTKECYYTHDTTRHMRACGLGESHCIQKLSYIQFRRQIEGVIDYSLNSEV